MGMVFETSMFGLDEDVFMPTGVLVVIIAVVLDIRAISWRLVSVMFATIISFKPEHGSLSYWSVEISV